MLLSVHFHQGFLPGVTLATDLDHHGSAVLCVALLDVPNGWLELCIQEEFKCDCVRLTALPARSWQ